MNGYCEEPDDHCLGMRIFNESLAMKYCGTETGNTVCCTPSGQVFTADIENSISFAIRNTVIYRSFFDPPDHIYRVRRQFTDESRDDFIEFLRILLKYLKFPQHVQLHTYGFIEDLYNKMKDQGRFTTSDLLSQLVATQNADNHLLFLSDWQPSVGCQNIFEGHCYAHFWRHTCGLWKTFHTITVSAYNDKEPLEVINAIKGFMVNYFDCNHCINHFKGMYGQTIGTDPSKVDTPDKAILWLYCAHNSVNQQWYVDPAAPGNHYPPHLQFPLHSACPECFPDEDTPDECPDCGYTNCAQLFCPDSNDDCWTFNPPNIVYYNFSEPAMLSYLKTTYGGPYSYLNTNSEWNALPVTHECPNQEKDTEFLIDY
ncbi:unnamed protein product [Meganyctiphanes norvegica]|uniref:Sulfhydryl oxidase n=1 Tax=Meganyctiphanes norvegica TaxID=48144 RepID=A0AAV2PPW7_MEGNR